MQATNSERHIHRIVTIDSASGSECEDPVLLKTSLSTEWVTIAGAVAGNYVFLLSRRGLPNCSGFAYVVESAEVEPRGRAVATKRLLEVEGSHPLLGQVCSIVSRDVVVFATVCGIFEIEAGATTGFDHPSATYRDLPWAAVDIGCSGRAVAYNIDPLL